MNTTFERSIVIVEDAPARFHTGLMDRHGNPIIRTVQKDPIGFVWFDTLDEQEIHVNRITE